MQLKIDTKLHEFSVCALIIEAEKNHQDQEIVVDLSDLRVAYPIGTLALAQYLRYNKLGNLNAENH